MAIPDEPAASASQAPPSDTQAVAPPLGRRALLVRLALSLVLAAGFVVALWRTMPPVPADPSVPGWVVPSYLLALLPFHGLRAARWHPLLRPLGPLAWRTSVAVGLAGYMWIALLPFRLGELARPWLLAARSPISARAALGAVAIERVVDGLVVCGLFFASVATRSDTAVSDEIYQATVAVVAVFASALVALAALAIRPAIATTALHATIGRLAPRAAQKLGETVTEVATGMRALPTLRPLLVFVALTASYWTANVLGMWLLARGCGLPLDLWQTVAVLAVMNVALLVPGGPAQFGVFQTGVALGLHLFCGDAMIQREGSRFALWLYVCQLGTIVAFGIAAHHWLGVSLRTLIARRGRPETP